MLEYDLMHYKIAESVLWNYLNFTKTETTCNLTQKIKYVESFH